jgi:hypothetical protein
VPSTSQTAASLGGWPARPLGGVSAACGGDGDTEADRATSRARRPRRPPPLGHDRSPARRGDVYTCQSFVADAGDAYGWLTTFEQTRSISGELTTPGYVEIYQIGGTASIYTDQLQSTDLRAAMRSVEEEGMALRAEIDAAQGSVSPTPLRQALDQAADVCEEGGFVIDWHAGEGVGDRPRRRDM